MEDQQAQLRELLNRIIINPTNPRTITPEKKNDLKQSLRDLPRMLELRPIVYDELFVALGGNMRTLVVRELVAEEDFQLKPDYFKSAADLTEEQKQEFIIKDNVPFGNWDWDILKANWDKSKLEKWGLDLTEWGNSEEEVSEDEAPPVSQDPAKSELGKVYQLGRHRVMCGDATSIENVETLMNGQKADMVLTDPPYGYKYKSNYQDTHKELLNDDKILDFFPLAVAFTQENAPIYTFCGFQTVDKWINLVKDNGLGLKNMIIWKKNNWSMGDLEGAYAGQYEIILYTPKGRVLLTGDRDRDVWEYDREAPTQHPTMKPVGLVSIAMQNHKAESVLDFFGGSGSTLIAAEQTNRTCFMMELDPKYCDVIRKRYAKFIGKEEEWESITPSVN